MESSNKLRRKLALAGIFSLTVFVMIFAIVRVVVISSYSPQPDATWLITWNFVEQTIGMLFEVRSSVEILTYETNIQLSTIAITIACLASYRALFTRTDSPSRSPGYQRKMTSRRHIFRSIEHKLPIDHGDTWHPPYTAIHTGVDPLPEAFLLKQLFESGPEEFAFNQIHVRHDINVATSSV